MQSLPRTIRKLSTFLILVVLTLSQAPLPGLLAQDDAPSTNRTHSAMAQVYTDRAAFDSALGGVANIPFEGFATGGGQANAAELDGDEFPGLTLTAGAGTAGLYVGIPDKSIPGNNDQNFFAGDFAPTSGDAVLATDLTGIADGVVLVDFATPTDGVGASFLDVEAWVSYVEVFDGPGGTGNSLGKGTLVNQGNVSQSFLGVAAEGIQSAVLQIGGSNDGVGLDDLRYGSPGGAPDDQAPAAVDDLAARPGKQPGRVDLSWTATGDDGHSGTASSYVIRHNSEPITESNWAGSIDVAGEPVPATAGSAESMTLSGLAEDQRYHFAIKVRDEVPLTSEVSNSPESFAGLTARLLSATTGMSGEATLTIGGQEVTFEPFDPEQPGLPLPHIKITAKEYTTHTILLWEDTAGDRPSPFYRPALDFLAKPLAFSTFLRPLPRESLPSYPVFLPHVIKNANPARSLAGWAATASASAADQPEGWDLDGGQIAPNTITAYEGPDATISGSEFAEHMITHYPDAKAFVFYHHDAVPSMDDAEMDIYEMVDEGVIAIELKLKGADPSEEAKAAVTEVVWHGVFEKISLHHLDLLAAPVTAITKKSFEHYNSQCIPVPDVTGRDRDEARTLLQQMGFVVKEDPTYSAAPVDQVIRQNRGPGAFSECALPGATVQLTISRGPATAEFELYSLRISTTRNRPRTLYEPGDTVWLTIDGVNHSSAPKTVVYYWQTTGPDGEEVAALSEEGRVVQVEGGQRRYPKLEGPAPEMCGEYTTVGRASFTTSSGSRQIPRLQAYFEVDGAGCIPYDPNRPPNQPAKPSPADGATNQALGVDLSWTGGDPDLDKVTYDVYWGRSNPPTTQIAKGRSQTALDPGPLKAGTRYYWQVVAWDDQGALTAGPVWDFTTGSGGSPPPGGMVFVPAGVFQMGCDPTNPSESCQPGQDLHSVSLDAFYIDKYEITNAQYAQCVAANACDKPLENISYGRSSYYDNAVYADYPVLWVSWHEASDYCTWAGMRLPTEAEWEKAARGSSDTRAFPWGNEEPDCTRLNYEGDSSGPCINDTSRVGDYPSGQSPYGAMDMAGNVFEWVSDWHDSDYYGYSPYYNPQGPASGSLKVVRGGSWDSTRAYVRVARRITYNPNSHSYYIGFRCVLSP